MSNAAGIITGQPECAECGGVCCQPERLEFPVAEGTTEKTAFVALEGLGLREAVVLEVRVNEHGRTVLRTWCNRQGHCREESRPEACLCFPMSYLADDHTDAERAEVAEFCTLFRRLRGEATA